MNVVDSMTLNFQVKTRLVRRSNWFEGVCEWGTNVNFLMNSDEKKSIIGG